jgi:hypothetical protein
VVLRAVGVHRRKAAERPERPDDGDHREVHGWFERSVGPIARLVMAIEEALTDADQTAEAERRRQLGLTLDSLLASEGPLPQPYSRERVREMKREFLALEAELAHARETKIQGVLRVRVGRLLEALVRLEHPDRVRYLANRYLVAEEKLAQDRTISVRTRAALVDALAIANDGTWQSAARKHAVIKPIEEAIAAVPGELAATTGQPRILDREHALLAFAEILAPKSSYEKQADRLVDLLEPDVSEKERTTRVSTYKNALARRETSLTDFCPSERELIF